MTHDGVKSKIEKQPSLIELCQVRKQVRHQIILALYQPRKRRQKSIVSHATQSISVVHAFCISRVISWLTIAADAGFKPKTCFDSVDTSIAQSDEVSRHYALGFASAAVCISPSPDLSSSKKSNVTAPGTKT